MSMASHLQGHERKTFNQAWAAAKTYPEMAELLNLDFEEIRQADIADLLAPVTAALSKCQSSLKTSPKPTD